MTRRRPRRGPPRCDDCHRPVDLLTNPHTGRGRMAFEQRHLSGRQHIGEAYPVEGMHAWRLADLVEDLMHRLGCSRAEAEDAAYAMNWQAPHRCPTTPQEGDLRP